MPEPRNPISQASWHTAMALKVPENISLLYLPSYTPELNAIERLWGYLKSHYLSNIASGMNFTPCIPVPGTGE
jgi:transposase